MTLHSTARQIALADRCYRLLLLAYPANFRRAYATEMASTFRACYRETLRAGSRWDLIRLWGSTLADLLATACKEHIQVLEVGLRHLFAPIDLDLLLTAPLCLQVAQQTDIGCTRAANEDNLITVLPEEPKILQEKGALFVVADGMGGHSRGERASELAVTTVREFYYQQAGKANAAVLTQAVKQANTLIYEENMTRPNTSDPHTEMGTTCIAAVLQEHTLTVANVGDSRVYVIHEGQMRQISHDHSLVADQVRAGLLTPEQARHHEKRNMIYRALGTAAEVEVDVFEETVAEGDTLILCTDGLSSLVDDAEILQIAETHQPAESVQQLIASANAAGGPDNITAIVVRVTEQN